MWASERLLGAEQNLDIKQHIPKLLGVGESAHHPLAFHGVNSGRPRMVWGSQKLLPVVPQLVVQWLRQQMPQLPGLVRI
eukprot:CAMPEP_0204284656 /NCGR_PEP_ID=MMETSP0468-20130131/49024_1 /ASSEMBLY_ACC=CAM_ASM_000383 /TAXON_ID=2969 /ORGANISM="Oxyrrhis marina" /LENGTH=78 /DNA_ID=CAMNT_0051262415 /DNA_START=224 /DNA_END=460 /DNA_ORIENTATION=-